MVSSAVFNCNPKDGIFDLNALQYTTLFKTKKDFCILPVRAYFDKPKYGHKRPMPTANYIYVTVEASCRMSMLTLTLGFLLTFIFLLTI
jgi:hypothetical protein